MLMIGHQYFASVSRQLRLSPNDTAAFPQVPTRFSEIVNSSPSRDLASGLPKMRIRLVEAVPSVAQPLDGIPVCAFTRLIGRLPTPTSRAVPLTVELLRRAR